MAMVEGEVAREKLRTCVDEGCRRKAYAHGWCVVHYYRETVGSDRLGPSLRITEGKKEAVESFYEEGFATRFIAHEVGISMESVRKILKDRGVWQGKRPRGDRTLGRRRRTLNRVEKLKPYVGTTLSTREVAEKTGMQEWFVREELVVLGHCWTEKERNIRKAKAEKRRGKVEKLAELDARPGEKVTARVAARIIGVAEPTVRRWRKVRERPELLERWRKGERLRTDEERAADERRHDERRKRLQEYIGTGKSLGQISRETGYTVMSVKNTLVRLGDQRFLDMEGYLQDQQEQKAARKGKVVAAWKKGRSKETIAQEYGLHPVTVRKYLQEAGLWVRPTEHQEEQKKKGAKRRTEIHEAWKSGMSQEEIAERYELSQDTVRKYLRDTGVGKTRKEYLQAKEEATAERRRLVEEAYRERISKEEIAERYGVHVGTVRKYLRQARSSGRQKKRSEQRKQKRPARHEVEGRAVAL